LNYQVSDKRPLRNRGNGKCYLVETGTDSIRPSGRRDGKPKFEQDTLESRSSGNHLKENPEVLSRLGLQAECGKGFGPGSNTAQQIWETEKADEEKKGIARNQI